MKKIIERIALISENEDIKITALERKIGASKGVLSRALTNKTDIQSKWITKIVENFPQYNTDWLISGFGPILKSDAIKEIEDDPIHKILFSKSDKKENKLEHSIEQILKENINYLKENNKLLKEKVISLESQLEMYKNNDFNQEFNQMVAEKRLKYSK